MTSRRDITRDIVLARNEQLSLKLAEAIAQLRQQEWELAELRLKIRRQDFEEKAA